MTVHIINAPTTGLEIWSAIAYRATTLTMCAKLVNKVKDGVYVRRLSVIPNDSPTIRQRSKRPKIGANTITLPTRLGKDATARERTVCQACLVLARMTPDARAQQILQNAALRKQKSDAAFAKLNEKNKAKKEIERAELDDLIEKTRADAMACYDGWLSEPPRILARCGHTIRQADGIINRCAFAFEHDGQHGAINIDGDPIEPAPDLDLVLEVALKALKRDTKNYSGDRLWVFRDVRPQVRTCWDCRDRPQLQNKRHWLQATSGEHKSHRDVVCRFCDAMLGENLPMGERGDYTDYTFYPPGMHPSVPDVPGPRAPACTGDPEHNFPAQVVNVRRHTVTCALKYLAKIPNRNDGLPEASFVLTFDDEDQPEVSP